MFRLTDTTKIGEILRDFRAMLGVSQADMAEMMGTRQGRYSEHETGRVVPGTSKLISMFHGIDFDLAVVPSEEGGRTWPRLLYPPPDVRRVITKGGTIWYREDEEGRMWSSRGIAGTVAWWQVLRWGPVKELKN